MAKVVFETGTSPIAFHCKACGERRIAYVRATGSAGANQAELASEDREANADRLLGCVPCPACGHVDPGHIRSLRRKAGGIAVGIAGAAALAGWLTTAPEEPLVLLIVFGACLVLFSLPVYLVLAAMWWWGAAEKVRFGDPMPAVATGDGLGTAPTASPFDQRAPSPFD